MARRRCDNEMVERCRSTEARIEIVQVPWRRDIRSPSENTTQNRRPNPVSSTYGHTRALACHEATHIHTYRTHAHTHTHIPHTHTHTRARTHTHTHTHGDTSSYFQLNHGANHKVKLNRKCDSPRDSTENTWRCRLVATTKATYCVAS